METWVHKLATILYTGFIGLLGGMIMLLYKFGKGEHFKWYVWLSSLALAFFTARLAGEFIAEGIKYRDGLLGVVGLFSYSIVQFVDLYGIKLIKALLEKKFEIKIDKNKE